MVVESTATGEDEDESMDVDVPDAEKTSQKSAQFEAKAALGGKGRVAADSVQLLRGHSAPVFLCAWCPSASNVLATGAGDGTARIWDLSQQSSSDGKQAMVLRHDSESADGNSSRVDVTSIVWNEQGTLLATACFNGQLRIWTAKGELKQSLRQRYVPIIAMRWNRKGSYLLSAYLDGTVAMWDVSLGQLRQEYKAHVGCVLDVDWMDNSTFASCGSDRAVKVWRENDSSAPIKTFTGHKSDINSIKWHPGGRYLASASDDGTVKIWSMTGDNSQQPVQDFFGHSQQVYLVRWLPRADKAIVASASFDGNVRVWDVHSKACIRVLAAHTKAVDCLSFSADARYLATGAFDKKVCIWNVKDGSLEKTYLADDAVHDVQWAPKGKVAAAIASSNIAVFDPLVNN
ncbi:Transducin beta-like [Coemansia guatemalensis]|uniref:Transducin beta-like n=1 Tax=Coemansia guatemalensis TaxID=2761395 RepID=A0A9W8HX85_9FUNG|nr:Transducin beta-like [Coemansia guatemalensis]